MREWAQEGTRGGSENLTYLPARNILEVDNVSAGEAATTRGRTCYRSGTRPRSVGDLRLRNIDRVVYEALAEMATMLLIS